MIVKCQIYTRLLTPGLSFATFKGKKAKKKEEKKEIKNKLMNKIIDSINKGEKSIQDHMIKFKKEAKRGKFKCLHATKLILSRQFDHSHWL